jgi:hypothetical protein
MSIRVVNMFVGIGCEFMRMRRIEFLVIIVEFLSKMGSIIFVLIAVIAGILLIFG